MISDPSFLILTLQLIYQPLTVKLSGYQIRILTKPKINQIQIYSTPDHVVLNYQTQLKKFQRIETDPKEKKKNKDSLQSFKCDHSFTT